MWSLADWFPEALSLTVVDVGAALSELPNYQALVDKGCAKVIGFEPDEAACRALKEKYSAQHVFLPYFVGDGQDATFHETNWTLTGSLYEPNTPLLDEFFRLGEVVVPVARHPVKTHRLDDISEITDIDFLKIDVQGSELPVFRNGRERLRDTLLIQAEVAFLETYRDQPMFSDVDDFLRSEGFQFHDFVGFGRRSFKPILNPETWDGSFRQTIWADAFYIRDWASIGEMPEAKLRNFAVLMHDVVGSYDVAYRCLCELDRRGASGLAMRYRRRLEDEGICKYVDPTVTGDVADDDGQASPLPSAPPVAIESAAGDVFVVPADLSCITTYVLLEQERWIEREVDFVTRFLREGMNACDVGANLGAYSIPMARAVGATGSVLAFEPGSLARNCLEESARRNGRTNLKVFPLALGDVEKSGWLELRWSGELNVVTAEATKDREVEEVRISTLDRELGRQARPIDFLKIDAEGMEARVIAGGKEFFREQSPLVMYEVKHGSAHNESLRWMFEALGFQTFRLSGSGDYLIPVGSDERIDGKELNYFAAKPDRVAHLAARGMIAREPERFEWQGSERSDALQAYLTLPFANYYEIAAPDVEACPYADALLATVASRRADWAPGRRWSALRHAEALLRKHIETDTESVGGNSTLVRILFDLGHVTEGVVKLSWLLARASLELDHPFLPPSARYEALSPDLGPNEWLTASIAEAFELSRTHSSRFGTPDLQRIDWLAGLPFASAELMRQAILVRILQGRGVEEVLFRRLRERDPNGSNRDLWTMSSIGQLAG